jgi:cell division protein FtsI (penicillin-binding protein 3)/stage V sporulation protein D (sporulation-specific penicillin-binding protein)
MNINHSHEKRSINRTSFFSFLLVLITFVFICRLAYLQIFRNSFYLNEAQKQYVVKGHTAFDRGSIFFSHYKSDLVPVAQLITVYTIAIDTSQITDKEAVYKAINDTTTIDRTLFDNKVSKINDPYEEIAKGVSESDATRIRDKNVKGINFVKESERAYPQDTVGSKIIGFVGYDGDLLTGRYGIERYYNDVLNRDKEKAQTNFFAQLFADIADTSISGLDEEEGDVVLTIDSNVERFLHRILLETEKTWHGDIVGGIVMDPNTGAIIAMDAIPSYDPNKFNEVKDPSFFDNQLVSGVYEMGSIIKPLTIASALDVGVVDEKTTYIDTGFRMLDGYKVSNYDGKARGKTELHTILDKSLNVGIVFVVEQLGINNLQKYFKSFGFGSETGIDLPSESAGLTKNLNSKVFVDSATAGFGQGFAMTPIQTIRALAILGNGGKLVNPHVADSILFKSGDVKKIIPDDGVQVIKTDTSERITRMLVHVVDTALLNGSYKMDHYSIAAKTGTAQIAKGGGGYYDTKYLHSFFGYFPAYDPKYIIFLFHTNPKGAEYASATLTDPFFNLVKFLISYYEVPPDR